MSEAFQRTWDGLDIAADKPMGATVVVRRSTPTGEREVLLLHRNANGNAFEGDWAWTCPAGCRQPGESVYSAALRELAEEAGLVGLSPWAVDLSGVWAVFAVDVGYDVDVDLVDPEHDRYAWLTPDRAGLRVLPSFVSEQQVRAASVPPVDIGFRPMTDADLAAVARWQDAPHVRQWFDDVNHRSEDVLRRRYTPRLRGDEPTRMWVVEAEHEPVGYLQDYRVGDHPDYAAKVGDPAAVGFDYVIGEGSMVNQGLGTRMIWEFCRDVLAWDYPDAVHFSASPSHRNHRSRRVLAKCGFTEGVWIEAPAAPGAPPNTEVICTLDVQHWFGERRTLRR